MSSTPPGGADAVPHRVLVVCRGNVCRSPVAERLLELRLGTLLGPASERVAVASAGTEAVAGSPMDESAARELVRLGGDRSGFEARLLDPHELLLADLVLTATRHLRSHTLVEAPRALKRTFTLTEFAALVHGHEEEASFAALVADASRRRSAAEVDDYDITDPVEQSGEVHRRVAEQIDQATRMIAGALAAAVAGLSVS